MQNKTGFQLLPAMLLVMFGSATFAANNDVYKVEDFMFAAELEKSSASLQRLPLDASILQHMQTTGVHDVRVFDANGQMLPAMVRRTAQGVDASEHVLNFFPLYGNESRDVRISSTDVERDASGLVMAIHSRQGQADRESILTGYIVDQTAFEDKHLTELEFESQNKDAPYMMSLRIETSDDLTRWTTLDKGSVIAHFDIDNNILRKNLVKLSGRAKRYLRLTLLYDADDFALKQITARYNTPGQTDYSWLSLGQPEQVEVNGRAQYEYVLPGKVVPAQVKFDYSRNTFPIPGRSNGQVFGKLSSLSAQHKWGVRQNISQYRVVLDEGVIESDPVQLGRTADRRWRFEPADGRPLLEPNIPEIKLAYPKYELVFVAQGLAPYKVAWGNADAGSQSSSLGQILSAAAPEAITDVRILGAEQLGELPTAADEGYVPWRKWLLFGVLFIAVLGAGRMAYQLFREMNA